MFWEWVAIRLRVGVPMGVVVWGYRGGVGTLRIPYKLSTYGGFRQIETAITRHTERRADFTGGFDSPMQNTAQ